MAALLVFCATAGAQDNSSKIVKEVKLQGLQRVSEQLVRSKIEVKAGQPYGARAVARDIRRLYETGYFATIKADAAVDAGKIVLTYILEEKRYISELSIVGNKKVRDRYIRAILSWREGDSFDESAYEEERTAILDLYETKGFPNAKVDIVVEEVGPSRVRITYNVEEGGKARIRKIYFENNDVISKRKLRKLMKTKRAWWVVGGKYDQDKFEADLENIVNEYHNFGRLEAEIAETEFAYKGKGKKVDVTVSLSEGPEYTVEALETKGNEVFDDDEMLRLLKVQASDVHNAGQVDADADLLQRGYEDSGYVAAAVVPQVTLDREKKTTHIVHRMHEGDLKYVREVKITGNSVTRDEVVRRELLLTPDERFDGTLVRASERRLDNSGFYDQIRLTREEIPGDDVFENLLVDVEEGKTGNFNFGGGYSTEEKLGGFVELRLNNFDISNWPTFSGGGQQFRLRTQLGDVRTQYSMSFTDPEFLGRPLAFGIDLYDQTYDYHGGTDYTEDTSGGQLRLGKMLSPYVTARGSLRYTDLSVSGLPWYATPQLSEQRGGSTTISNAYGINRNTVDLKRDPASGAKHDLEFEVAGLGGDNHFLKLQHDSIWYYPITEDNKWVFSYRTREGWITEYGSSEFVPITYRFFAGGSSTVRGFESRDIGPQVRRSWLPWDDEKDRVGGEMRWVQNIELKYKLTDNIRFYTFIDSGGVWADASDFDLGEVKFSTGIGFGVNIPRMGPVRVDYGFPLNADGDQGNGRLHLLTGLRF